jgi:hypothetical protein
MICTIISSIVENCIFHRNLKNCQGTVQQNRRRRKTSKEIEIVAAAAVAAAAEQVAAVAGVALVAVTVVVVHVEGSGAAEDDIVGALAGIDLGPEVMQLSQNDLVTRRVLKKE